MNAMPTAIPPTTTPRFIDNGDGTITLPALGLMFTKATLCDEEVDHDTAAKLCADCDVGGHRDWRRPTVQELFATVDHTRHSPAIDTDFFPDTKSDWYWTDTITAWSPVHAWVVLFHGGGVGYYHRDYDLAFVRAVRSVPAGQ